LNTECSRTHVVYRINLYVSHVTLARDNENISSAELVAHDGELHKTVIALADSVRLPPHNSPPAASIQVLTGSIRVELDEEMQGVFGAGGLWMLTHERHSGLALEGCVLLSATVTSVDRAPDA